MIQGLANRRVVTPEIMDSPNIAAADHVEALLGLERINRVSRTVDRILAPIIELARRNHLENLSLMDIACGGGDVPIGIAIAAKRLGVTIDLTLLDRRATALGHAAQAAASAGIVCRTIEADTLANIPMAQVDVVTNSLFLHHVPEPHQVVELLRNMRNIASRLVVISDLRRSRLGFAGAWTACRLLTRSRIVHHDGPVSVRAAWTLDELSSFADQAGMSGVKIQRCQPWRMLLTWERQGGSSS